MADENPIIPNFDIGELLSAADMDTIADALRRLQDAFTRSGGIGKQTRYDLRGRAFIVDHFLAETQETGCSTGDTTAFTDARYYLQRSVALPDISRTDILDTKPEWNPGWKQCLIGTNLAELPPRGATGKGSHLLPPMTRVHVWSMYLRSAKQRKVYWFTLPVPSSLRYAKLTQTWAYGTNVLTANPCDWDGSNVVTATTIYLHLQWPLSAAPQYFPFASGDTVMYQSHAAGVTFAGHAIAGRIDGWNPFPPFTERYQVVQGDGAPSVTTVTGVTTDYVKAK